MEKKLIEGWFREFQANKVMCFDIGSATTRILTCTRMMLTIQEQSVLTAPLLLTFGLLWIRLNPHKNMEY